MLSKFKKLMESEQAKQIAEKAKQINEVTKEKVDGAWAKVGEKAGAQLNRMTGREDAAENAAKVMNKSEQMMQEQVQAAHKGLDIAAEKTAQAVNDVAGTDISKRAVKVAMVAGAAVVAGAVDGLADMAGGEAIADGLGESLSEGLGDSASDLGADTASAPEGGDPTAGTQESGANPEIDISQNGRVVSDGNTTYVTVDGMTVRG